MERLPGSGAANTRWGTNGMLWTEAWCGIAGIVVFVAAAAMIRRRQAPSTLADAAA